MRVMVVPIGSRGSHIPVIIIIIIIYFYNAHNTLQVMSLCAVRKRRLGGGTVQVHDIIEIIQIGRFFKADLKCSIELIDLKESGRLFHMSFGPWGSSYDPKVLVKIQPLGTAMNNFCSSSNKVSTHYIT